MQGVCSPHAKKPKTVFASAGNLLGYSSGTQLVPAHETATYAKFLQHGSSLPCTTLAAPKQPTVWHNVSSASRTSYTASAMLQNVKAKFSCQSLYSSAAQWQGTGSNAMSGSLLPPSQTHTLVQVTVCHTNAKSCHWPDMSGEALLLLHFWQGLNRVCQVHLLVVCRFSRKC